MKKTIKPEQKSKGTVIAEKARAQANSYSDEKRAILIERGMSLIYGTDAHAKCTSNRH
jgi:hypothetical protein